MGWHRVSLLQCLCKVSRIAGSIPMVQAPDLQRVQPEVPQQDHPELQQGHQRESTERAELCEKPCKDPAASLPALGISKDSSCSSSPDQSLSCRAAGSTTPNPLPGTPHCCQAHPYHGFPLKPFPLPPESIPCSTAHRAFLKRAGWSGLRRLTDRQASLSAGLWPQLRYKVPSRLPPPGSATAGAGRRGPPGSQARAFPRPCPEF